jgi:hypothetical protein
MAHSLFKAQHSQQGIQGVLKEGAASRIDVVSNLVACVGGRVESAYWAFGDDDFIMIAELPGNAAAAAAADEGFRERRRRDDDRAPHGGRGRRGSRHRRTYRPPGGRISVARSSVAGLRRPAGTSIANRAYSVGVVVLCDGASRRSTCFSNRPCAC